jgi:uncharacterized protein
MLCRRFAARAILIVVAVMAILAALAALTHPAAAQADFPFGGRRAAPAWPWQWGWGGQPPPPQQQLQREKPVDFTRAPPPKKQDAAPAMSVMVMGDSLADWLAYGLEDAFSETPEIGVVRKHRAYSGLIKGETKAESYDWPQAAREILAAEKVDFVVMMIGLADRQPIRERQIRSAIQQRQAAKPATGQPAAPGQPMVLGPAAADPAAPAAAAGQQPPAPAAAPKPAEQQAAKPTTDAEAPPEDQPPAAAPESSLSGATTYEFRSEKWADFYSKRIDDTIAALKSKGVPVFWVGLPAIRGTRSTSEMVYLNELYRGRAEKAGINYVDVWDGFVDEAGNFSVQGPDFEGQIRRLRTGDGVHFTRFGSRKLAHYVEREIRRVMLARGAPMATPAPEEPAPTPAAAAKPSGPAPRPVAGPVVPLAAPTKDSEGLLGGGAARSSGGGDAVAAKVTIKGETMSGPKGRADDFAWPRQDGLPEMAVGVTEPNIEPAPADPAAGGGAASSARPQPAPPAAQQPAPRRPAAGSARLREPPREPPPPPSFFQGFFGFGR